MYDERGKLLNLMDDDQGYYTYKQSKFSLISISDPRNKCFPKTKTEEKPSRPYSTNKPVQNRNAQNGCANFKTRSQNPKRSQIRLN